jgi:hypothetical protein
MGMGVGVGVGVGVARRLTDDCTRSWDEYLAEHLPIQIDAVCSSTTCNTAREDCTSAPAAAAAAAASA